jgi:hypothetical protein
MTKERAFEINAFMVRAWCAFYDASGPALPSDMPTFTLAEALEASEIVASTPPEPLPGGGIRVTSHVVTERIPGIYAWATTKIAMDRICKEHAANGRR